MVRVEELRVAFTMHPQIANWLCTKLKDLSDFCKEMSDGENWRLWFVGGSVFAGFVFVFAMRERKTYWYFLLQL